MKKHSSETRKRFGSHMKGLRKEKRIKANRVAYGIGVSTNILYSWERGESAPCADLLQGWLDMLGTTYDKVVNATGADIKAEGLPMPRAAPFTPRRSQIDNKESVRLKNAIRAQSRRKPDANEIERIIELAEGGNGIELVSLKMNIAPDILHCLAIEKSIKGGDKLTRWDKFCAGDYHPETQKLIESEGL